MANKIQIDIDAVDNASAVFNNLADVLQNGLAKGFTGAQLAAGVAGVAIGATVAIVKDSTKAAFDYDQQILGLMNTTKLSAEETSKLVQTMDDAGVSFDVVTKALKEMSKDGTEPNIEQLAALSDQFLQLNTGAERGQFLLDKFGKSGQDMARAMQLGGSALKEMYGEMEGGLILTEKSIRESEEYRKNIDQMNDSWMEFKVTLGNAVLPVLNDAIQYTNEFNEAKQRIVETEGRWIGAISDQEVKLEMQAELYRRAADGADEFYRAQYDGKKVIEDNTVALSDYNISLDNQLKTAMNLTTINADYAKSQNDISVEIAELQAQKAAMYPWEISQIEQIEGKISDLSVKYDENATAHEERTNRILLDMTLEKIAMSDGEKGFSEAEYAKALAVAETLGAVEAASLRETLAMDAVSSAVAAGTLKVENMQAALDLLKSKSITLTVNQVMNLVGTSASATQNYTAMAEYYSQPHATGGNFTIPSSYGNEGFNMGGGDSASGGEGVKIIPKGKTGNEDVIEAIEANRMDENKLGRAIAKYIGVG